MSENATPRFNSNGFRDDTNAHVSVNTQIPAHLPVIPILTQKGPSELTVLPADKVVDWYGVTSFENTSAYYTHQTALAAQVIGAGNNVAVKRIIPSTAKKSFIRLAIELAPCEINDYVRNVDGSIKTENLEGLDNPVVSRKFNGTKVVWHSNLATPMSDKFGEAKRISQYRLGNQSSLSQGYLSQYQKNGTVFGTTILLPILDIELADEGVWGDDIGLVIEALTNRQTTGADRALVDDMKSFLYKLKIVQRTRMGYNIRPTYDNDLFVKVSFIDTDIHPDTNKSMFLEDVIETAYNEPDTNSGTIGARSPFGQIHVYSSNYKEALDRLVNGYMHDGVQFLGEKDFTTTASEYGRTTDYANPDNSGLLNLLTGNDIDSVPYHAFTIKGNSIYGGIEFNTSLPIYGQGGSDGLTYNVDGTADNLANLAIYDGCVRTYVEELAAGHYNFADMARYPVSAFWDSGYSLDTKKSFIRLMGIRKDITVFLSTFIQADYTGTPDAEVPEPVRPTITCVGGQMDAIFEVDPTRLYNLEIDGRTVAVNVDITQLRISLQSYSIGSALYERDRSNLLLNK